MACMAVPPKYKRIADFHEYYSGKRTAPYLTIFIGGNHEASNHLFELYYGGWVAPNIYYMGAANVLRYGPLRIAALSGIWKGYDYRKPHFERLPYNDSELRSIFHVRELEVRKLLQIRTQVDLGLSHDWPRQVEYAGDYEKLFRIKKDFRQDSERGLLGNAGAKYVLDRLRPAYWFSAHFHIKFAASIQHEEYIVPGRIPQPSSQNLSQPAKIPYMFGMDGSVVTTMNKLLEDQEQQQKNDRPLSARTANEAISTEAATSNNKSDEDASELTSQTVPENGFPAADPIQPAEQGHNDSAHEKSGDTQSLLSAWNNFHNVAATQEAAENSRFLMEQSQNKEAAPEVQHNLTWRRVDIDQDGLRRRPIGKEEAESAANPESKKQKTQHKTGPVKNADEIDLDLDSDSEMENPAQATFVTETKGPAQNPVQNHEGQDGGVPEDLRNQLPASFTRPEPQPTQELSINGPLPEAISNTTTKFLALDKCEPRREFLNLMELRPISEQDGAQSHRPYCLQYDKEWLAITRVFADDLHLGDPNAKSSNDKGDVVYKPQIIEAEKWVEENVVKPGKLDVPENFTPTAPFYDPAVPVTTREMPPEYNNPQTAQFCELIGIDNKFYMSDEERQARANAGLRRDDSRGGGGRPARRGIGHDRGRSGGRHGNRRRN